MRRRRSDSTDSLDMLLDALCNMFGGIIFIALLVAVMGSEQSTEADSQTSAERSVEALTLAHQLRAVSEEIQQTLGEDPERMSAIEKALQHNAEAAVQLDRIARLVEQLESRTPPLQLALQKAKDEVERLDTLEQTLADARDQPDLSDLTQETETVEQALRDVNVRLQGAARRRTVHARLGLERSTSLLRVFVWVGPNRAWVMVADKGEQGALDLHGYNPQDVDYQEGIEQGGRVWRYNPKPGGGFPVTANAAQHPGFRSLVASFPPRRFYVLMTVQPDAHATYALLRNALVSSGYRYNLNTANGREGLIFHFGNVSGSTQ